MSPNDTPIQLKLPLDGIVEIPLTHGQIAIVDLIDSDLANMKWQASFNNEYAGGGKYLVTRAIRNEQGVQSTIYLHRVILSRILERPLLFTEKVDHIHGLTLDNRRSELRLATNSQNAMNSKKRRNNTSGRKGVTWAAWANKWRAQIWKDNKRINIGYFDTVEDAYIAYCAKAIELHGDFALIE